MPQLPTDWNDRAQVKACIASLWGGYYDNPDLFSLTAVQQHRPVGVVSIKTRNNVYVPEDVNGVYLTRLIVDPERRRQGIAISLSATAIELMFERGFDEIYTWIMTDRMSGNWWVNWYLFRDIGFQVAPENPHWHEYQYRGFNTEDRDATLFHLTQTWYQRRKQENPKLQPYIANA